MICVVDASVAAKWFLEEPLRDEALRILDEAPNLLAPDWIVQEIAHVAFKKWRAHDIGPQQARIMVQALEGFIGRLHPSKDLAGHALEIALTLDHPVYDCLYLACARVASGVVITADEDFCAVVKGTEFAPLMRYLGDMDFPQQNP